ncbi:D-hexose-6-phosphate mutarotase [Comamonas koreensis]|uniref:Putative glucose-6-phosphate 1-epimerase n=1 Tax=Comamonas koreensis TaxID=160825 RepID=A0AAW4Y382_9BURK|nr:D-hexose-6-phosphate mutarotase [Comamonas koreensis]MCD2167818.1 D-hexose-6-phosphate mutarotase [Comamonas koreensis]
MAHAWTRISYEGFPAWCAQWADGTSAVVAEQGAQLLSWKTADGREHLYLSPASLRDGQAAIRGGVPVCFPQFNVRGPLPKHGFARNLRWQMLQADEDGIVMQLTDSAATRAFWPHAFDARLRITVHARQLTIGLDVQNTGQVPWSMTCALHSYLQVDDVAQTRLTGLQGLACWDALADTRFVQPPGDVGFAATTEPGFDRVFSTPGAAGKVLQLQQPGLPAGRRMEIVHSGTASEIVVWNPGVQLSHSLADMPDDGWRQMLCVEAASIDTPVQLAPGQQWSISQTLTLA